MTETPSAETKRESTLRFISEHLGSGAVSQLRALLNAMRPGEIAHLLESCRPADRTLLWNLVSRKVSGEILLEVNDDVRDSLLKSTTPQDLIIAAGQLETDDLADLVQELPELLMSEVLRGMDQQNRERLDTVLSFDEDSAGGLMNVDTITIRSDATLEVVLSYLRSLASIPDPTDNLIVVDINNRFQGVLPLTRLLNNDIHHPVNQVMIRDYTAIPASLPSSEVALLFEQRDLVTAPVVDDDGLVLGRITVDDVVDVIREEADHSLMSMAGLDEEHDMFAPVIQSARRRSVWLALNLLTALLASWVIGLFDHTIEKVVALAVLMPIVASMGGIAGGQTLTLVIRGLALRQLGRGNQGQLIWRELGIGILNGIVWAIVVAVVAGSWFSSVEIGSLIATAIVINLICAAIAGTLIPLLLHKLGVDPALAGGVLLTTVTDVVGFLAFLGLASIFLA